MLRFRKQYDEVAQIAARNASAIDCSGDPGITSISAARDADINEIARRCGVADRFDPQRVAAAFEMSGLTASSQPFFGDFSQGMSYHEGMNRIRQAEQAFMELPAKARSVFGNQASFMMDAVAAAAQGDKEAIAALERAGIADIAAPAKPAAEAAAAAPAASQAASEAAK